MGNKWGQAPFCKKEDILIQKMGPVPIYSAIEKRNFATFDYLSFPMIGPDPEETSYWRLLFQEIIPGKKGNKLVTFLFQVFPSSLKTIN